MGSSCLLTRTDHCYSCPEDVTAGACYCLLVSEATSASAAQPHGTTRTVPLSKHARELLHKTIKAGRISLALAVLVTAGAIGGSIAAKNAVFISFLPAAGYFAWIFYKTSIRSMQDLREGTMVRYQGHWQERTAAKRVGNSTQYRLYVQTPSLDQPLIIRQPALVKSVYQAGVDIDWVSSGGKIEYATRSLQPLTYERRPAAG
jgi:hypothetical protein